MTLVEIGEKLLGRGVLGFVLPDGFRIRFLLGLEGSGGGIGLGLLLGLGPDDLVLRAPIVLDLLLLLGELALIFGPPGLELGFVIRAAFDGRSAAGALAAVVFVTLSADSSRGAAGSGGEAEAWRDIGAKGTRTSSV